MVRLKARYLLFEILYPFPSGKPVDGKTVLKEVKASVETHFGELGIGSCQSMLAMRYFNPKTGQGIIRVGRSQAPIVQGALTYIRELNGQPVVIRVTHVSGTIQKCERRAVNLGKQELVKSSVMM